MELKLYTDGIDIVISSSKERAIGIRNNYYRKHDKEVFDTGYLTVWEEDTEIREVSGEVRFHGVDDSGEYNELPSYLWAKIYGEGMFFGKEIEEF